jgi:hypothetical protein
VRVPTFCLVLSWFLFLCFLEFCLVLLPVFALVLLVSVLTVVREVSKEGLVRNDDLCFFYLIDYSVFMFHERIFSNE